MILDKIMQVDSQLSLLRSGWMDSIPEKKGEWMARIDAALDERIELMKERDSIGS